MDHLKVNLNELPAEGKRFTGTLGADVFGLSGPVSPEPSGPVQYDVVVRLQRDLVLIEGSLETDFQLTCSRCLERFPWAVRLPDYFSDEPRDGRSILDLTETLREDILLALPGYPHCEDSNVSPRICPEAGRFASASEYAPISEKNSNELRRNEVWGVLDEVKERLDESSS
ncbi:MAG: hypothetical protein KA004_12190 [Verrucomicrobiales bacterium]|nr:hypothetical protein [Verrucomicrobiales bacterium]